MARTASGGRRRPLAYALVFVLAVAAALSAWPFFSVLEIARAEPSGQVALCARMHAGEEFVLSFIHSVNRRPVFDTLRAEGDHLVIVRSRFDAFGAGMPEASSVDGTLIIAGDGWLEWSVNRPVPELTIRVGRVAEHTLQLRERRIALADLAPAGTALTLRVRPARLYEFMKGRCMP